MCISHLFNKLIHIFYFKMKNNIEFDIIDINKRIGGLIGSNITASKWTDKPLVTRYIEKLIIDVNRDEYNRDMFNNNIINKSSYLYNIVMSKKFTKPTVYNLLSIAINIGLYKYYNNGYIEDWMVINNWLDDNNIEIMNNMLNVHNDFIKDIFLIINHI